MGESSVGQREARSLFIMKTSIFILGLSLVLSNVSAKNFGGINIEGAGMVYVVGPDWSAEFVSVNGNGVTLSRGGRIYFAKDPVDDFSNPYMYWQTPLLGKRFSFDVDLSRVGCHCNAAAYLMQIMAIISGVPNTTILRAISIPWRLLFIPVTMSLQTTTTGAMVEAAKLMLSTSIQI